MNPELEPRFEGRGGGSREKGLLNFDKREGLLY